jgi:hypothetical protein
VAAGRDAEPMLEALFDAVEQGPLAFPEWRHGRSGAAMGEPLQLWSATGVLYAIACVEREGTPLLPLEGVAG